jgi:hypothetical protein
MAGRDELRQKAQFYGLHFESDPQDEVILAIRRGPPTVKMTRMIRNRHELIRVGLCLDSFGASVMVVRNILMILANLLLASQALAQQPEPDQNALFAAFLNSPVYHAYLEQIFNAGEPAILKAECPAMKVVVQNRTSTLEQPKFVRVAGNFQIDTGSWIALVTLDRCGSQVTRRALLKAGPTAHELQHTLLLPGDFRGNLQLEADAVRIVTPLLMAFAKCQDQSKFQVINVAALTPASASGWSETWTAMACDTKIDAEVTYTAMGAGMKISAGKWKV